MTGRAGLPPIDARTVAAAEVRLVGLRLRRTHRSAHDKRPAAAGAEATGGGGAAEQGTDRPTVIVRLVLADGSEGWGECPALPVAGYTAEHAVGSFERVRDELLPALVDGRLPATDGHPMATGAVRDALLDAVLRGEGRSLAGALGGERLEVPARSVVSAETLDDLIDVVAVRAAAGYRHIGLKVEPGWLHEPLAAIRSTWPDLGVSIDGNGSLDGLDDEAWRRVDALRIDVIEQPCPPGDLRGSARVAGLVRCPVALDESIVTVGDLDAAVGAGACGMVNVKPARVGGVVEADRVARAAVERGLAVFVGGMLESGVGRATALALAATDRCTEPTHLGPSEQYWEMDLTAAIVAGRPGHVLVPSGMGIGVTPDQARLDAATLDVATITP